ncbi:MAG: C39 family peptidase [Ruminococcus flavefaciens]|nr:C39 family peptidase [Ruminococcus flavefaciens]MCM1229744.1 C39 family peptidase [Ruminococcus flavefaciens]
MKIFRLSSGAMVLMMLTSCGRTVYPAGENDIAVTSQTAVTVTSTATTVAVETTTEPTTVGAPQRVKIDTAMPEDYPLSTSAEIKGFETVYQEPELPTGCEVTALAQTINFYGFDIDKVELCDVFMPIDHNGYYTMDEAYLGDPHSTNGYGCSAPAIANTADDYFEYIGSDWYAIDLSGITLDEVFYQIEQGRPVIIWTTIDQRETIAEFEFVLGCGEELWFNPYQHCVTIYGYDKERGIVNIADPLRGNVEYDMERFGRIYNVMGQQAVILVGNDESAGKVWTTAEEQEKWLEENRPEEDEETTGEVTTE